VHRGRPADLFHLREDRGAEVDLIVEAEDTVRGVETKSGATIAPDFLGHLQAFGEALGEQFPHLQTDLRLVHGGTQKGRMSDVQLIPWGDIQALGRYPGLRLVIASPGERGDRGWPTGYWLVAAG
jgi:hypothetical protein